MGAAVEQDESGIWIVRISGFLRKDELDAIQATGIKAMNPDENARVLVVVEDDFSGWVGSEVWHDLTFLVEHGDRIEKIAIVGDARWETEMLMFTGAGFRRAPVKYFTRNQLAEARTWLKAG